MQKITHNDLSKICTFYKSRPRDQSSIGQILQSGYHSISTKSYLVERWAPPALYILSYADECISYATPTELLELVTQSDRGLICCTHRSHVYLFCFLFISSFLHFTIQDLLYRGQIFLHINLIIDFFMILVAPYFMINKKNKSAADEFDDNSSGRGYYRRWERL